MTRFCLTLTLAGAFLSLSGLIGCGEGVKEVTLPDTVPVTGTVTLNDKPADSASVTFYPDAQTGGTECVGTTGADGKYTLKQQHGGDGAPPGRYKVVISRMLRGDGTPLPPDGAGEGGVATESLPPRYSSLGETELTAQVPEGGGEVNFQLTTQ